MAAVSENLYTGEQAEVLPADRLPGSATRGWQVVETAGDGHEYIVTELFEVEGLIVRLDVEDY